MAPRDKGSQGWAGDVNEYPVQSGRPFRGQGGKWRDMIVCHKCGGRIEMKDGAKYCPRCGPLPKTVKQFHSLRGFDPQRKWDET